MNQLTEILWAKSNPHHPLWCHLLDTAAVARALVPRFGAIAGLPESLPDRWIPFLVGCHDIGKADDWFQNKDPDQTAKLHDLGLELPLWNASEPDKYKRFRHEVRSREWLQAWLEARGWSSRAFNVVAKAVVGHHGDWDPQNYYTEEGNQPQFWQPLRDELGALLWDVLQPEPLALKAFPHASVAGAKLSAYVILSDWIASNDKLFPFTDLDEEQEPAAYFKAACALAREVVSQLGFGVAPAMAAPVRPTLAEVWPPEHFPQMKTPRPLQTRLDERREELKPGLAIIEAPTGEGKTEAAIYLAQLWNSDVAGRGTFFALPTQATSNAMFTRYSAFLKVRQEGSQARLLHGMAWLSDDVKLENVEWLPQIDAQQDEARAQSQARTARDWFRPSRRALLGQEGVGTVDQALLCALRVKFGTLRLLGLSQKTLIVDECHAYDEFMSEILERLLQWCRALEINVILLSATLAHDQKMKIVCAYAADDADLRALQTKRPQDAPYPLLTFAPRGETPFDLKCEADPKREQKLAIELKPHLLEFAATAQLAARTVEKGGCLCVLANTVRAAQEIFRELEALQAAGALPDDCKLDLFHARFRAEKRAQIEKRVVAGFGPDATEQTEPPRPRCAILVATQVVEQSLDVDFDFLISQIAPVDLLLQRAGRLWRHQNRPRVCKFPTLTILTPPLGEWDFGASGYVYQPEVLLRTLAIANAKDRWKLPQDYRKLVEDCYRRDAALSDFAEKPGFAEALVKGIEKRDAFRRDAIREAKENLWIEPDWEEFEPVVENKSEPDEEGTGEAHKYFVARTRLGDPSAALLAVLDAKLLKIAKTDLDNVGKPRDEQKSPLRADLKQLFGCKVGVPLWWIFDDKTGFARPLDGFEPLFDGKSFLRGHVTLPLQSQNGENVWHGQNSTGRFAVVDDPTLGLLRRSLDDETAAQTPIEVDAGELT